MTQGVGKRLSREEKYSALSLYQEGNTSTTIARLFGISDVAVRATIRRLGGTMRDAHVCHRKYQCNPLVITHETIEGAYWLGFFAADGYVSDSGRIELHLGTKDSSHVEAFRDFLGSNHPVKKKLRSTGISIRHPEITAALARYGIGPRKSLTFEVPSELSNNTSFWRGLLDGDGWIATYENSPRISLVGSRRSMEQFKLFCEGLIPGKDIYCKKHPKGEVWYVRIFGSNARVVGEAIYGASGPCLERKSIIARSWKR